MITVPPRSLCEIHAEKTRVRKEQNMVEFEVWTLIKIPRKALAPSACWEISFISPSGDGEGWKRSTTRNGSSGACLFRSLTNVSVMRSLQPHRRTTKLSPPCVYFPQSNNGIRHSRSVKENRKQKKLKSPASTQLELGRVWAERWTTRRRRRNVSNACARLY